MMPKENLRKADIITSIFLIALGVAVIVYALGIPQTGTFGGVTNAWYVSPAIFPYMIGGLLIGASLIILARAIKEGGLAGIVGHYRRALAALPADRTAHRIWVIWIVMGVYIFAFFGKVNFYAGAVLFLFLFTALFHRDTQGRCTPGTVALSLAVAVVVACGTGFLFKHGLLVPLP